MTTHTSIAIIGATTPAGSFILSSLSELVNTILITAKDNEEHMAINNILNAIKPKAQVEVQACAREGCWESDIIFFADTPGNIEEISSHIKDVVTQKTVVTFLEDTGKLEQLLPYSKIVKAQIKDKGFHLESIHEDALEEVESLFQAAGLGLPQNVIIH